MIMICRLLDHAARDVHYHNQGMDFALCARCGEDLIRQRGAEWTPLPLGMHVVWRPIERDATAVAARMAGGAVALQHNARQLPRPKTRALARKARWANPLGDRSVLVCLCGKFMLAGIADRLLKPMAKGGEPVIRLPAPKAASRSIPRSRQALSPARNAARPRRSDRR